MRRRRRPVGVRADLGWTKGDGGTVSVGDLWFSQLQEQPLLLAVEGCDVGVDLPEYLSPLKLMPDDRGLDMAGDRALRNSVYAVGGVMGVLMSSSSLMRLFQPGRGLRGSSEGRVADTGVLRACSSGLTLTSSVEGMMTEGRVTE